MSVTSDSDAVVPVPPVVARVTSGDAWEPWGFSRFMGGVSTIEEGEQLFHVVCCAEEIVS
jgi:hypothetical protein